MRSTLLLLLLLFGCEQPLEQDACGFLTDLGGCPECADGDVTCSFEDTTVTEMSCGGCQAEMGLFQALCDSGSTASATEILADRVCEDTPQE